MDATVVLLNFKLNSVKSAFVNVAIQLYLKSKNQSYEFNNEFNSGTGDKKQFFCFHPTLKLKTLGFRTLSLNSKHPNKSGVRTSVTPRLRGFLELCFLSVSASKTTSQLHPHMAERFRGRGHM